MCKCSNEYVFKLKNLIMCECMNWWLYKCMNISMFKWTSEWMYQCMDDCMYECMSVWMNECMNVLTFNTRRSYSKKVTRRSFGGLFWPIKRNRYNFWTIGNISTKFSQVYHIYGQKFGNMWKRKFPRWRPTWPPKFRIECIFALLSNTETNKVPIHIKWRS